MAKSPMQGRRDWPLIAPHAPSALERERRPVGRVGLGRLLQRIDHASRDVAQILDGFLCLA